jgi:hypothetical protein
MISSQKAFVVLAIVGSLLIGCSKPHPLAGQVFIVMRNGQSVKLGLAEVRLFDRKTFDAALREWKQGIDSQEHQTEVLRSQSAALLNASRLARDRAANNRVEKNKAALDSRAAEKLQAWLDAEGDLQASGIYHTVLLSAAPIFAFLSKAKAVAVTKTDADGNFLIEVPARGSFVIAATATREVMDSGEAYFWTIAVPEGALKVTLSNDNLTTSTGGDSLVHTADITTDAMRTKMDGYLSDLQKRIERRNANLSQEPPESASPLAQEPQRPEPPVYTPIPESPPLPPPPPPEFVRLTKEFTLVNAKGKEVKTLERGKRLRVVARSQDGITVDFFGERFLVPTAVTEPSK